MSATRYIVLVESDRSPTRVLLNLREVFDPTKVATGFEAESIGARHNGDRVNLATARLWSWRQADPFADTIQFGRQTFKVLSWSSYFQSLERYDNLETFTPGMPNE